jgi:hypothetical protein
MSIFYFIEPEKVCPSGNATSLTTKKASTLLLISGVCPILALFPNDPCVLFRLIKASATRGGVLNPLSIAE